jgi:DHA2 family multidrug resistance protein
LRGAAAGFIFLPLTTLSLGAVKMEDMGTASGLFNMVRTIGGSVGIAILVGTLSSAAQIHQNYLAGHLDLFHLSMLQHALPSISGDLSLRPGSPTLQMMYLELQRQASVMAFIDDFRIIAYIFFILTPLALLMGKPAARSPVASGH